MEYLYHGSCHKLKVGDKLRCNKQFNHRLTDTLSGVFATSLLKKAKYFGIRRCITPQNSNSFNVLDEKNIFVEDVATNIIPHFYVYLVKPDGFVLDDECEYISKPDVEICKVMEFDLVETLEQEGFSIYKVPHTDVKASDQKRIQQINDFVKNGQFVRLDIASMTRS